MFHNCFPYSLPLMYSIFNCTYLFWCIQYFYFCIFWCIQYFYICLFWCIQYFYIGLLCNIQYFYISRKHRYIWFTPEVLSTTINSALLKPHFSDYFTPKLHNTNVGHTRKRCFAHLFSYITYYTKLYILRMACSIWSITYMHV